MNEQKEKPLSEKQKKARRIEIVQDVIAQIHVRRINMDTGVYLRLSDATLKKVKNKDPEEVQLQGKMLDGCTVCGLGSLLVAEVDKRNRLSLNDYNKSYGRNFLTRRLGEVFHITQLNLIEYAFEGTNMGEFTPPSGEKARAAARFYDLYPNNSLRMIAICENIIRNKGTFNPEEEILPPLQARYGKEKNQANLKWLKRALRNFNATDYSFEIVAGSGVWVSDILNGKMSLSPETWEELRARVAHFMRLHKMSEAFRDEKKKFKKPIVIWR